MDRICPFLALRTDHRTAIDGYDPDHACHAQVPPQPLERARQAELCLADSHRQCEFYRAYLAEHAAAAGSAPLPAPDTHVARTRLIVEPEARRLGPAPGQSFGTSPRRWLVAGAIAAVGVAAAATAAAGGFNSLVGGPPPSASAGGAIASNAPSTTPASSDPTPSATEAPSGSKPTIAPTATATSKPIAAATPQPRSYVVRDGDTLSSIANRFGTSVTAIQRANGLADSDVINVGQTLVIP